MGYRWRSQRFARQLRELLRERLDVDALQECLPQIGTTSPPLTNDICWNGDALISLERAFKDLTHALTPLLERDQGSCIERETDHAARRDLRFCGGLSCSASMEARTFGVNVEPPNSSTTRRRAWR